jgi:hypothetical protein
MNERKAYELHIRNNVNHANVIMDVTLYNRALQSVIREFLKQEQLVLSDVLMTDDYICYEIVCGAKQAELVYQLEERLTNAAQASDGE